MARKLLALLLGCVMVFTLLPGAMAESDLHIADDVELTFWFDLDLAANVPGMKDYNDSEAYKWHPYQLDSSRDRYKPGSLQSALRRR